MLKATMKSCGVSNVVSSNILWKNHCKIVHKSERARICLDGTRHIFDEEALTFVSLKVKSYKNLYQNAQERFNTSE